jgi:DNA-binding MarR family transcriptional regulator
MPLAPALLDGWIPGTSPGMTTSVTEGRMTMKRTSALQRKAPDEAGERRVDFDELPTYVGYQVRRAQARIFAEFESTLGSLDFTPGSFGVLTLIRANPGITQVALAAAFGIDKSTVSPVIVRLEKRGFVRREVLESDRRCHALFFEASAEPRFLAARDRFRALEAGVAARLSKAEQRELSRLLAKLCHPGISQSEISGT